MLDKELLKKVLELNALNGEFDHLYAMDMDDLEDYLMDFTPSEIVNMVYFGDFKPTHDYFRIDGYGNLKSVSEATLAYELEDERSDIEEAYAEL